VHGLRQSKFDRDVDVGVGVGVAIIVVVAPLFLQRVSRHIDNVTAAAAAAAAAATAFYARLHRFKLGNDERVKLLD
jgi:hypothetical protein